MKKLDKVEIAERKMKKFKTGKNEVWVKVNPFITISQEVEMAKIAKEAYFDSQDDSEGNVFSVPNRILAEAVMDLWVVDEMTNISVENGVGLDLDTIRSSGILDSVKERISNFDEVKNRVWSYLSDVYRHKESIRGILSELSSADVEDALASISSRMGELKENLEESPISSLLDEGMRGEK